MRILHTIASLLAVVLPGVALLIWHIATLPVIE